MRKLHIKSHVCWNLLFLGENSVCLGICMQNRSIWALQALCENVLVFTRSEKWMPSDFHTPPSTPPKKKGRGARLRWRHKPYCIVLKCKLMLLLKGWINIRNKQFLCTDSQGNLCWHHLLWEQEQNVVYLQDCSHLSSFILYEINMEGERTKANLKWHNVIFIALSVGLISCFGLFEVFWMEDIRVKVKLHLSLTCLRPLLNHKSQNLRTV